MAKEQRPAVEVVLTVLGAQPAAIAKPAKAAAAKVILFSMFLLGNPSKVSVGRGPVISFNQISC